MFPAFLVLLAYFLFLDQILTTTEKILKGKITFANDREDQGRRRRLVLLLLLLLHVIREHVNLCLCSACLWLPVPCLFPFCLSIPISRITWASITLRYSFDVVPTKGHLGGGGGEWCVGGPIIDHPEDTFGIMGVSTETGLTIQNITTQISLGP